MSFTLASITPRIRARLNDQIDAVYHDDLLLPYAQDATDELQGALELYGLLVLEKIGTIIPIPANTTRMAALLPADMLEPQRLEERLSGSTDLFIPMVRREWEPDILPSDSLRYWTYREEDIFFVGATQARDVKIYYLKRLFNVTSINDPIPVNNAQLFLITRIAAMAAADIGEETDRAEKLGKEADSNMDWLIRIGIKSKQGARTRRRPYVITGRRRWI